MYQSDILLTAVTDVRNVKQAYHTKVSIKHSLNQATMGADFTGT